MPPSHTLISLNIGLPAPLRSPDREVVSGIRKGPITGALFIDADGCAGDGQADLENHAGPDKAVCVYASEHLPYWSERLGRRLEPGAFGENFSTVGLAESDVRIGDVFELGGLRVQVSQPRGPCFKLGMLHGEPQLARWVQEAGLTGFYLRCLTPGTVTAGLPIRLAQRDPANPTVAEVARVTFRDPDDRPAVDRVLTCPALADAWRQALERRRDKRG